MTPSLDERALREALTETFDPAPGELRVVVRAAADLATDGRYERDTGRSLTVELIVAELADAPDEGLPERWNWWLGALEIAYGGYAPFGIRAVERE